MQLTDGQKAKVREKLKFLDENPPPCPLCAGRRWLVSDVLFELREHFSDGSLSMGGPVFPVLPIICETCGYSYFLNAVVLGLVEHGRVTEENLAKNRRSEGLD